jgi:hypothetical protein
VFNDTKTNTPKKMKAFLIITIGIAMVIIAAQVKTARSAERTEQYPYSVIKTYRDFEVRQYERAIFARTRVDASTYRSGSSAAFRTLASYIFGGNERNENIAMTSPVAMQRGQGLEMEFMMPSKYTIESLPAPNRQDIEFYEKPEVVMAAISFKGWASDAKIAEMTETLKGLLAKEGIAHTGNFIYLGYNPPYQVINRRNEIVVEIMK